MSCFVQTGAEVVFGELSDKSQTDEFVDIANHLLSRFRISIASKLNDANKCMKIVKERELLSAIEVKPNNLKVTGFVGVAAVCPKEVSIIHLYGSEIIIIFVEKKGCRTKTRK